MNILRHNRNLLTKRMVKVDTVKKSWKNTVLGKYDANDWLTKDGSGKYAINLNCLLYCHYIKLKGFKNE